MEKKKRRKERLEDLKSSMMCPIRVGREVKGKGEGGRGGYEMKG